MLINLSHLYFATPFIFATFSLFRENSTALRA